MILYGYLADGDDEEDVDFSSLIDDIETFLEAPVAELFDDGAITSTADPYTGEGLDMGTEVYSTSDGNDKDVSTTAAGVRIGFFWGAADYDATISGYSNNGVFYSLSAFSSIALSFFLF